MASTCDVCRGALPSGEKNEVHTALCAEVVRRKADEISARLGYATLALMSIARDVPHDETDWCAHCYAAEWARRVTRPAATEKEE